MRNLLETLAVCGAMLGAGAVLGATVACAADNRFEISSDGANVDFEVRDRPRREVLDLLFASTGLELKWLDAAVAGEPISGRFQGPLPSVVRQLLSRTNFVIAYADDSRVARVIVIGPATQEQAPAGLASVAAAVQARRPTAPQVLARPAPQAAAPQAPAPGPAPQAAASPGPTPQIPGLQAPALPTPAPQPAPAPAAGDPDQAAPVQPGTSPPLPPRAPIPTLRKDVAAATPGGPPADAAAIAPPIDPDGLLVPVPGAGTPKLPVATPSIAPPIDPDGLLVPVPGAGTAKLPVATPTVGSGPPAAPVPASGRPRDEL